MLTFDVYSRRGCHLCELMIEALLPLINGKAILNVHDIDTNPQWRSKYDLDIPVLEIDGLRLCRHRLDDAAIAAVRSRIDNTRA